MRIAFLPLALFLAAAASAQTVTLKPAAKSGYKYTYYTSTGDRSGTIGPTTVLQSALETLYSYRAGDRYGWTAGDRYVKIGTFQQTERRGWMAEFALPTTPVGMGLASATLSADVTGATQPIGVGVYAGDGVVRLADALMINMTSYTSTSFNAVVGAVSYEVSDKVRLLLDAGKPYAGLRLSRASSITTAATMAWSNPILTLVYGYPIKASLALGGFYGDATKVPVAYEVRRPNTREVVASGTLYPDASGAISPVVPPGTWDVSLKPSHWLRRTIKNVVVADGPRALPEVAFVNGDANGDNVVSAADRALVTSKLGTYLGQSAYSAACDLTGDGYVTAKDRALVTLALGTVGDD